MKRKTITHTSYLTYILALAFAIGDNYLLSLLSFCISCALLALILYINMKKVAFTNMAKISAIIQLLVICLCKNALIRISGFTLVMALISIVYNTLFYMALNTLSKRSRLFIVKMIGTAFSILLVLVAFSFISIAYRLGLKEMVSIGYIYLLVLNYIPLLFAIGSLSTIKVSSLLKIA